MWTPRQVSDARITEAYISLSTGRSPKKELIVLVRRRSSSNNRSNRLEVRITLRRTVERYRVSHSNHYAHSTPVSARLRKGRHATRPRIFVAGGTYHVWCRVARGKCSVAPSSLRSSRREAAFR